MSIDTKSEQLGCLDFGVIEESLETFTLGSLATSLKHMQDSLDELDRAVTTFRQEINLKMSHKSVLLQEYFQWGEKNVSNIAAWKATHEEHVHILEQESSRIKGNQARLSDFYETAGNDIIKLHETIDELQQCTLNHGQLSEGLKEMKVLFSSLQDKIKEVGAEVAWAQTMVPSLQNDLCAAIGHVGFSPWLGKLFKCWYHQQNSIWLCSTVQPPQCATVSQSVKAGVPSPSCQKLLTKYPWQCDVKYWYGW
ncbi:hypothetical protein EDC04DRAFT_2604434 [Pisolithus marmoratus]|nr:hypothetical protein EDC04DRAFT_2604434 [Pisolithus marmoratus]